MLDHKRKWIFVEVPKTGSSSIRHLFLKKPWPRPHLDIMQIKSRLKGGSKFDEYFKFGFVRNPWARAVSLYYRNQGVQLKNKMSFVDFIKWHTHATDTCIYPTRKKYQLDFFTNPTGDVKVNFIGKFETLQQDFNTVCDIGGLPRQKLPHKNKSKHKHYTKYYDNKTRKIVAKRFAKDIEYFGYEFGE